MGTTLGAAGTRHQPAPACPTSVAPCPAAGAIEHGEHGVHIVDSLEFNYRDATTDPAVTAVLDYDGGDDVAAEVRRTITFCLAHEADGV